MRGWGGDIEEKIEEEEEVEIEEEEEVEEMEEKDSESVCSCRRPLEKC